MEAKSEIRLPIFESCPLTNRRGMVGESTFSENPSLKSAVLILSKPKSTTHVEIISEIENVPNYLRVQWLEKDCGGQSQSFWLTQHPLHQVGSPTCIWIPQQSPRRETFGIYLYNLTIGRITRLAKVNLSLLTSPLPIFLHLKKFLWKFLPFIQCVQMENLAAPVSNN